MEVIPYSVNVYSGTSVFGYDVDDNIVAFGLPFTFSYFGVPFTQIVVSSNGFIQFPGSACFNSGCCAGSSVFSPICPAGYIAGWWDDLLVRATDLVYRIVMELHQIEFSLSVILPILAVLMPIEFDSKSD